MENHFWQWFKNNQKNLRFASHQPQWEREEILYWFEQNLKYFSPEIGYRIISPENKNEKATLAFSAGGIPELRAQILRLIVAAPKLKYWTITAFITSLAEDNPSYFNTEYCLNGITFKPSQLKFWGLCIDDDTNQFILGIVFDFPTKNIDSDLLRHIVWNVLTDTLGELIYDRFIEDYVIFPKLPKDEITFELSYLKTYLEDFIAYME